MVKKTTLIILISAGWMQLFSQDTLYEKAFYKVNTLEIKTGTGINFGVLPLNMMVQKDLNKTLATILMTEFGLPSPFINTSDAYIKSVYFYWIESIGAGVTFGQKRVTNGLFVMGGGKYYYSKLTVNDHLREPTLITSKILPEIGFLYRLGIGRKKFYFATQLYIPVYPFKMYRMFETNTVLTMGVGYRFGFAGK